MEIGLISGDEDWVLITAHALVVLSAARTWLLLACLNQDACSCLLLTMMLTHLLAVACSDHRPQTLRRLTQEDALLLSGVGL